jgi:hypothetical protein
VFARVTVCVLLVGLLSVSGCGPAKLDVTKTLELNGETPARSIELPEQPKAQKIKVEFDAGDAEVNVGVFKAADANLDSLDFSKAIAAEKGKKSGTITADVPEKTTATIVAEMASKKASVKVHATN